MVETPKGIVKSSQRKIIRALTDPEFDHVLMLESPAASVGLSDPDAGDLDGDGDVDEDDRLLRYYLRLMALLEACCCEQNTLATGVVQKLISEDVMFDEVLAASVVGDLPRKTVFSKLLLSVYFDTPLIDATIRANPKTWAFLANISKEALQFGRMEWSHPSAAYLHDPAIPCVVKFFANLYRHQGYPDEVRPHREELVNNLWRAIEDDSMSIDVRRCGFTVCELLDPSRVEQRLDPDTRKELSRHDTSLNLRSGRKKSSAR
jgi:hypothetical protein